jgi:short-subunit dehydrogenase
MFSYKGSYVLVTGASIGLGSGVCGAACLPRSKPGADSAIRRRSRGARSDLGDRAAPLYLGEEFERHDIVVDLLINNAAFGHSGNFLSHSLDQELGMRAALAGCC